MGFGMIQREAERSERLAAAGWHGQGEQTRPFLGLAAHLRQDVGAQIVQFPALAGGH
ncbi:hypothetical protein [Rhizobium sp. SL86]|uniref:hypothetical protein n=1 Tax=Rhizobium sp. SL86 TaxID=2995148 RepID=UPI00227253BD|nr:hypothetical protein [Rhizobium sp. SL86]MCY1667701.1 hypothetical protein [Rhizobium sp. SL86]